MTDAQENGNEQNRDRSRDQSLGAEIREIIAHEGPISIERYMALALTHPTKGYYTTHDPFGVEGDFVTAPEISQMFGELIGLWAAPVWTQIGAPVPVHLVELGPGRGALMADALRAARAAPEFFDGAGSASGRSQRPSRGTAARGAGRQRQARRPGITPSTIFPPLRRFSSPMNFSTPCRCAITRRTADGWHEASGRPRRRGRTGLRPRRRRGAAVEAPWPRKAPFSRSAPPRRGWRRASPRISSRITARRWRSITAISDTGFGETLQAVKAHEFVDPLAEPGQADLTTHVDFAALAARRARGANAETTDRSTRAIFERPRHLSSAPKR